MFVLGFRAKKMRQTKLAELIHQSEGMLNIDSCTVEVHFELIIDRADGGFDAVPGSKLVVSRSAWRNGRNAYAVNGTTQSAAEVTALLKGHGIDLDHNRFLILQGEVESIAQMKPKGATEHEEGLLEYLEDIIGTAAYIAPIAEAGKEIEVAAEAFMEKQVRVKAAARECEALSGEKEKAEAYLRQENALVEMRSQRLQALLFQTERENASAAGRLDKNRVKLEEESAGGKEAEAQLSKMQKELEGKVTAVRNADSGLNRLTTELARLEAEDVRLQETRKHVKTRLRNATKTLAIVQQQRAALTRDYETVSGELAGAERELESLRSAADHEEAEVERLCKSMQSVTGQFQAELGARQAELGPVQERLRNEQQALELAIAERDLLRQKASQASGELSSLTERITELEAELLHARSDKERLDDEAAQLAQRSSRIEKELEEAKARSASLTKELDVLVSTLAEARECLGHANTGSAALRALLAEKRAGRIPGVHGRLGDLGSIETRYDTAVSTAAGGFLNHIVVDTTATGQRCIEHLRKNSLGRASFIILEKMRSRRDKSDIPRGAQRLFDLVQIKDDNLHAPAFEFALGETLVAESMEQATAWAYHSGPKRHRVVTLDGRLIETSGTMAGGGRPQRGGMRLADSSAKGKKSQEEDVTPEQVQQLEACLAERRQASRQLATHIQELEGERQRLLDSASRLDAQKIRADTLCNNLPGELEALRAQLPRLQKASSALSPAEQKRLYEAEKQIAAVEQRVASLRAEMEPLEAAVAAVQAKIMNAGGVKFRAQKSKADGLKEQVDHVAGRVRRLAADKAALEARLAKEDKVNGADTSALETELKGIEEALSKHTESALAVRSDIDSARDALESARDEHRELSNQVAALEKEQANRNKGLYELRLRIEQDEERLATGTRNQESYSNELASLTLHHIDPNASAPVLAVIEEESELLAILKRIDALDNQIANLAAKLEASTPNLRVLGEYRVRAERLAVLEAELAELDARRLAARDSFDGLRQRRHDEFMTGFRAISLRLKELYQLITMGGNAELELVDSLDPFAEGILFSVMPPRKSWKTIANLSGGEKTLSSLALVFALHTYRPTPIYVMDEIDAALDFRNVSIVAHYIKERTRDAQFVVISLRNDMFELADRLVGIYKTEQRTRSVTIDPANFVVAGSQS